MHCTGKYSLPEKEFSGFLPGGIYLLMLLILHLNLPLYAQQKESASHFSAGIQGHYGFIIPHSRVLRDVSHTRPRGIEVNINRLHTSMEKWKVFNAYWISGVECRYFNYQDPQIIGEVFDLSYFVEPILASGRNYRFSLRGGTGLTYHTRVYDLHDNPMNLFFSSKISFPLFVDARFRIKTGPRTMLLLAANYNHISNGGTRQPNYGMNFPTFSVGMEHFRNPIPYLEKRDPLEAGNVKPASGFLLQTLASVKVMKETEEFPQKTTFIYGFSGRYHYVLRPFYGLNAGAEIIHNGFLKEATFRDGKDLDPNQVALTLGHDFMFSKVVFTQYLGVYVYSPYKPRDPVYQKYELSYRVHPRIDFGVFMKAHLHVAEILGISINFRPAMARRT